MMSAGKMVVDEIRGGGAKDAGDFEGAGDKTGKT